MRSHEAQLKQRDLQHNPCVQSSEIPEEEGYSKIVNPRGTGSLLRLYLLEISETRTTKSHQHDGLNMTHTRMTPIDRLTWKVESSGGLNPAAFWLGTLTPMSVMIWKIKGKKKCTELIGNEDSVGREIKQVTIPIQQLKYTTK